MTLFYSCSFIASRACASCSGGCGWGEVVNGGFGLVLDGTDDAERRARSMLFWDVNNGVSRRAWGGNDNAHFAIQRYANCVANCTMF